MKRRMLFAVAVAASATLPAAEYFADAINGNDANDGRTEATAKLSLKAALALRRGDNKIEYFNTRKGDEVDFLVTDKLSKKRRLVQVAWDMSSPGMEARELSALKAARNEIKVDDCTVVTWDEERETDGIKIVPAWKWCLDESPN